MKTAKLALPALFFLLFFACNKEADEQKTIARYWDDNPFVIEHSGHLMFGNKKITPGGHWMGIAGIAAKEFRVEGSLRANPRQRRRGGCGDSRRVFT